MIITLIFLGLFLLYIIIDYFLLKWWAENSIKRINKIFDGIKNFLVIHLIDRFSSAFESVENESENEKDESSNEV